MKIAIIGLGYVGTSVAISVLQSGIANELLLNDIRSDLAEGEAMDLAQGQPFYPSAKVRACAVEDMCDADAIVIAAGRGGNPDESRLALLGDNMRIMEDLGRRLSSARGVIVVVTNPVDILTLVVAEASGLPRARVIGTGTMLDTARLRYSLSREIRIEARSIHANVLGEHGDSSVVPWSSATIGGRRLRAWPGFTRAREEAVATEVRRAAQEIIRRKGATNHAIGLATAALLRWILRGERRVLCISRVQEGAFGLHDVALSLPTVVGVDGATTIIEPDLESEERAALAHSADVLRQAHERAALAKAAVNREPQAE